MQASGALFATNIKICETCEPQLVARLYRAIHLWTLGFYHDQYTRSATISRLLKQGNMMGNIVIPFIFIIVSKK